MEQMNLDSPFNFLGLSPRRRAFHVANDRLQVITGMSFSCFASKSATPLRPHFPGLTSAAVIPHMENGSGIRNWLRGC